MDDFDQTLLRAGLALHDEGETKFTGWHVQTRAFGKKLVGFGTLVRSLWRLEHLGYLASRRELDEERTAGRPPRWFYWLTPKARAELSPPATPAARNHEHRD